MFFDLGGELKSEKKKQTPPSCVLGLREREKEPVQQHFLGQGNGEKRVDASC